MNVLVTGGAGFIGSHLAEALVRLGHRVRVVDSFFSGKRSNLAPVEADLELVEGDCTSPETAARVVDGMEAVFHEAAVPSVARSVKDPLLSHQTNPTATLTMLEAARAAGVRRFVFAGSSSVYGNSPELPKREDMETRPLSPYGVGKLSGEHYVRVFASLFGMETLTLRYFNVFGPRQDPSSPYSGVISRFVTWMLQGQTPVVFGDGEQSRDFTYVANVVDANLAALAAPRLSGEAVNIATSRRVTLMDLLRGVARETGQPLRSRHEPERAGDIRHSLADISKAERLIGYRPRFGFEDGLHATVEWYRSQPLPAI
jgi:UDP-glucose 4-epimerase